MSLHPATCLQGETLSSFHGYRHYFLIGAGVLCQKIALGWLPSKKKTAVTDISTQKKKEKKLFKLFSALKKKVPQSGANCKNPTIIVVSSWNVLWKFGKLVTKLSTGVDESVSVPVTDPTNYSSTAQKSADQQSKRGVAGTNRPFRETRTPLRHTAHMYRTVRPKAALTAHRRKSRYNRQLRS